MLVISFNQATACLMTTFAGIGMTLKKVTEIVFREVLAAIFVKKHLKEKVTLCVIGKVIIQKKLPCAQMKRIILVLLSQTSVVTDIRMLKIIK